MICHRFGVSLFLLNRTLGPLRAKGFEGSCERGQRGGGNHMEDARGTLSLPLLHAMLISAFCLSFVVLPPHPLTSLLPPWCKLTCSLITGDTVVQPLATWEDRLSMCGCLHVSAGLVPPLWNQEQGHKFMDWISSFNLHPSILIPHHSPSWTLCHY